jgi:hypothetical protein
MNDSIVTKHESFAMASFSRVMGDTTLVGSEFTHHHFMKMEIKHAEHHRDLSKDWWFARESICEVWMSEAQFCEMISRPNIGGGVPVTLRRIEGKVMPLPPTPDMRERYIADLENDAKNCVASLRTAMDELKGAIDTGKIGKAILRGILSELNTAACAIDRGIPWVAEKFSEAMEGVIGQAKTEIEAHVSSTAMRIGMDQMRLKAIEDAPRLIESKDKAASIVDPTAKQRKIAEALDD